MKVALFFGIACAVGMHVVVILFGGIFFLNDKKDQGTLQQVELLSEADAVKEKEKPKDPIPEEKPKELETEDEKPPDAAEMIKNIELSEAVNSPALDAASLSAIEAALSGQSSGGDFAQAMDFSSGGRIGGTGKAGALDENLDKAFSLAEIDQKPRAIFQAAPIYPSDMRSKKIEGVVTVLFVVDASGRVGGPRVEKSTHPSFDQPAMDAVKKWKFEPAIRAGQRVACKMRVPIRFQPS